MKWIIRCWMPGSSAVDDTVSNLNKFAARMRFALKILNNRAMYTKTKMISKRLIRQCIYYAMWNAFNPRLFMVVKLKYNMYKDSQVKNINLPRIRI